MENIHYEIERKFLIRYPDKKLLETFSTDVSDIEQIYLFNDIASERIRKRGRNGIYSYYHTLKVNVTEIKRIEEEKIISREEYELLKKRANTELSIIYKTRYCIPFKGHILEIDVFPFWKKQAFLEVELKNEDELFELPEFVEIIKDVSSDNLYSNRGLARKIPEE